MKNKFSRFVVSLLIIALLLSCFYTSAAEKDVQEIADSIITYRIGSSDIQGFADNALSKNAGIDSEWYVLALSQTENCNFSGYTKSLDSFLKNNKVYSATTRQKYALALIATGSTDEYIHSTLNNSIGKLGVMSWVYGLHLLNNGYIADNHTVDSVKEKLLSLQKADGGWSITGKSSETDATAMAIQALACHYKSDSAVKAAVDKGLSFLSSSQNANGTFSNYGSENAESTAQVIIALSVLSIDAATDDRFIKNGKTLFDGIKVFALQDGSYCHIAEKGFNAEATAQVFHAMHSYIYMKEQDGNIYIFRNAKPQELKKPEEVLVPQTSSEETTVSSETPVSPVPVSSETATVTESSDDTQLESVSSETQSTDDIKTKETAIPKDDIPEKEVSYKPFICIGIIISALIACLLLYIFKKFTKQNILLIGIIAVVLILAVCFINISSNEEHYGTEKQENAIGTVTLSVNCEKIAGKAGHIPENGIILKETEIDFSEDETVFGVLSRLAKENKILIESTRTSGPLYIRGISNIYEFDFGDLSGWIYTVNGKRPPEGCDEYKIKDGDIIEWHYSLELGEDIE